jgi:hypothetical protein
VALALRSAFLNARARDVTARLVLSMPSEGGALGIIKVDSGPHSYPLFYEREVICDVLYVGFRAQYGR